MHTYTAGDRLYSCVCVQGISVVEQEQLDNRMIEMDGTENKCES